MSYDISNAVISITPSLQMTNNPKVTVLFSFQRQMCQKR